MPTHERVSPPEPKEMRSPVAMFGGPDEAVPAKTAAEIYAEMFARPEASTDPDTPPASKP